MPNPINKGSSDPARRLPQINNPLTIRALNAGARVLRRFTGHVTPSRESRDERLKNWLTNSVGVREAAKIHHLGPVKVSVDVQQSFGKPTMISSDIILGEEQTAKVRRAQDSRTRMGATLDHLAKAVWNNPEIAPAGARARIVGTDPDGHHVTLIDMTALGFQSEVGRPEDMYAKYGPPAADPAWRP